MINKWTNSYLIFILAILGIGVAFFERSFIQIFTLNSIFFLTMLLIFLNAWHREDRQLSSQQISGFLFLVILAILSNVFIEANFFPSQRNTFVMIDALIKIGFYGYGWLSTVKTLMRRKKITGQTIILAITGYIFIGIICSFFYYTVWEIEPSAFHLTIPTEYQLKSWNLAMYFSLTTLTTLGYGDIVPVHRLLMFIATFEAIVGTIYLTVIIARLISLDLTPD
jgi:hypothetical protein